jgi:hypothetical protein
MLTCKACQVPLNEITFCCEYPNIRITGRPSKCVLDKLTYALIDFKTQKFKMVLPQEYVYELCEYVKK